MLGLLRLFRIKKVQLQRHYFHKGSNSLMYLDSKYKSRIATKNYKQNARNEKIFN